MTVLAPDERRELKRWALSGAVVLFAHVGIAAAMVQWKEPAEPDDSEGAIAIVELAPVPEAPMEVPNDMAPPEQVQPEIPPEPPQEKVEEKIEPAPEPNVAMLPPPEPEPPKPNEDEPPPPPVVKTPPPVREAPRPAAPVEGAPTSTSNAVPRWKSQIVRLLERNKRYPSEARSGRPQGVAQLAFTIDRRGRVVSSRIVTSSGSRVLDKETLDLVQRTQPFPPPPPELTGEEISVTVPIRFKSQ